MADLCNNASRVYSISYREIGLLRKLYSEVFYTETTAWQDSLFEIQRRLIIVQPA